MDRSHFFISFELSCPARPLKRRLGGLSGLALGLSKIDSCSPCLHCREWSCVVLCDSPRRHNGSGRDWPDKRANRENAPAGTTGLVVVIWSPECTGSIPTLIVVRGTDRALDLVVRSRWNCRLTVVRSVSERRKRATTNRPGMMRGHVDYGRMLSRGAKLSVPPMFLPIRRTASARPSLRASSGPCDTSNERS